MLRYEQFKTKHQINDIASWLQNEHWVLNKSCKQISDEYGVARITLTRWAEKDGVRLRGISEDNYRRYADMSFTDKQKQTKSANTEMLRLMKNEGWKSEQMRKVYKTQRTKQFTGIENTVKDILNYLKVRCEPQKQIGVYIVDFFLPEHNLVVECDGEYWHSKPNVVVRDKNKNIYLAGLGLRVLRLKEKLIKKDPFGCAQSISTMMATKE